MATTVWRFWRCEKEAVGGVGDEGERWGGCVRGEEATDWMARRVDERALCR